LFNLFRYRSQAAWWGWDFLYGTLLYRRQNQGEEMVFSVLGGFLEFERDTQESILRFLYLPLRWERRGTAPESRPPTVPEDQGHNGALGAMSPNDDRVDQPNW
ncbi:MAG: hypothetical protein MK538_06045, partial [Planctomycetes bacterium]|nr:hypothetical protein [Planctomycetota bacterium]